MVHDEEMIGLETERLLFRAHALQDLEPYCAMEADPEVRRYVGGAPRPYEDAKKRFLAGLPSAEDRLSLRAVVLKSEGVYIGRAGLYPHFGPGGPVNGEASISFYLARPYWGQGLATEAGAAFVRHGFGDLGLARIVTTIDARNEASRRVLEKLRFRLFATEPGTRQFDKYELLTGSY
jgi:ribosomal-protein-alanine N-acetyltransferase